MEDLEKELNAKKAAQRGEQERKKAAGATGDRASPVATASARGVQEEAAFEAAKTGNVGILASLPVSTLNNRDSDGWTLLSFAASTGQLEAVKLLLSHGADINARNAKGDTPLMLATVAKQATTVRYLREAGADVGFRNVAGASAYSAAIQTGDEDVVAAVSTGMEKLDFITSLDDLYPDKYPSQNDEEIARLRKVNPGGYHRWDLGWWLWGASLISEQKHNELANEHMSNGSLEPVLRDYAKQKGVEYDQVTVGRVLVLMQADVDRAYEEFWKRIRSSDGVIAGQHGLYMAAYGFNSCGTNNWNWYIWSEGNTILISHTPNQSDWDKLQVLKSNRGRRTTISEGTPTNRKSFTITQTEFLVYDANEKKNESIKIGEEWYSVGGATVEWRRCKE